MGYIENADSLDFTILCTVPRCPFRIGDRRPRSGIALALAAKMLCAFRRFEVGGLRARLTDHLPQCADSAYPAVKNPDRIPFLVHVHSSSEAFLLIDFIKSPRLCKPRCFFPGRELSYKRTAGHRQIMMNCE